jgi:hypothetical protein
MKLKMKTRMDTAPRRAEKRKREVISITIISMVRGAEEKKKCLT